MTGNRSGISRLAACPATSAFFYESGMTIDADGAPNAYHPDNTGLDDLANAGTPGTMGRTGQGCRRRTLHSGAGRSVSRLLRFGNGAGRSLKAGERSHALRGCVENSFRGAAGRNGAPTGSAARRFRHRFQSAKRQNAPTRFLETSGRTTGSAKDRWRWPKIWEFGPTRETAARGEAFCISCFPGSGNGRPRTIEEINSEGQKLLQSWEELHFAG